MESRLSARDNLVFAEFLEHLRRQGFTIGVDHHLRLQELLDRISGSCAPSDLKTILCPIFASNKKQQEQFYSAFDTYFDIFQIEPSAGETIANKAAVDWYPLVLKGYEPEAARKWPYVLAGALLLTLIVVVIMFLSPTPKEPTARSQPETQQIQPEPAPEVEQPTVRQAVPSDEPIDEPDLTFYQRYGKIVRITVLLAPVIFFLFYEWYRYDRRKLVLKKQHGKKPPYVWPMRVEAHTAKLFDTEDFYSAARLMRRRQVDEFRRLDVNATIAATIESLGYPTFCYKSDSKPPEYLALIDRLSFRDHQAQLFNELVNALEQEGIFIIRYFFDGDPRVCRNEDGDSFHLEELHDRHASHRLLIFGDGEKMIDPITGKLEPWAAVLLEWRERAVLTPHPARQWGLREITLATEFILLPAMVQALLVLVDQFEASTPGDLRIWRENNSAATMREFAQPGIVDALRKYLGEETFQWVCACAVYPELQWDLTLYMASLPCMGDGLVTEKNLLQLARLPYFRTGTMSDDLRWLLIRELNRDKEAAIRSAIIDLLEKNPPPSETFAAETYKLNLVVQRWLYHRSRKTRRDMLRVLRASPPSRVARDYTLLRFLESRRGSPLDLLLPRRLRNLFYRDGIPAFGLRTSARLVTTLAFVALAWIVLKPAASSGTSVQLDDATAMKVTDVLVPSKMVYIPGGRFLMGYNGSDQDAEKPEHEVSVQPFLIDQYEVTLMDYYQFIKATNRSAPGSWPSSWTRGRFSPEDATLPVIGITWFDARDYAGFVGKRLPTEEEWEYAARGSDGRVYSWGNDFDQNRANIGDGSKRTLKPVGSYPEDKSPFGVYDMCGNVFEWVGSDWSIYPGSKAQSSKTGKMVRGGSFSQDRFFAMVTSRSILRPDAQQGDVGFRCARDVDIAANDKLKSTNAGSAASASGSILIRNLDSGMIVSLDGEKVPESKIKREKEYVAITNIPVGYHSVKITGGSIAGWQTRIHVDEAAAIVLFPEFRRSFINLVVKSEPNAKIYADGKWVGVTSNNGELTISDLSTGVHKIRAEKDKFNPSERTATLKFGTTSVELKLEPATATATTTTGTLGGGGTATTGALESRVHLMGDPSKPLPGATVTVINNDTGLTRSTVTDVNGNFFFGTLPPGAYQIRISLEGYNDLILNDITVRLSKNSFIIPPPALRPANR